MNYEPILPLRTIAFQVLFLMVAVSIEAGILRQRLRLGFKTSVQYALVVNLAAVVVGWIAFLVAEPLSPPQIKTQIISYIFFDRLLLNGWTTETGAILLGIGFVAFFTTFFIKAKGIEFMMRSDDAWKMPKKVEMPSRDQRYVRARAGRTETQQAMSSFSDAIVQANAASFTAISLLLLLRFVAEGWV